MDAWLVFSPICIFTEMTSVLNLAIALMVKDLCTVCAEVCELYLS